MEPEAGVRMVKKKSRSPGREPACAGRLDGSRRRGSGAAHGAAGCRLESESSRVAGRAFVATYRPTDLPAQRIPGQVAYLR